MKRRRYLIISIAILMLLVLTKRIDDLDQIIYQFIQPLQTPLMTKIMICLTYLGSGYFYVVVLLICFLFKRKQTIQLSCLMILSYVSSNMIKFMIQRPRPLNQLIYETNYSFPSSHALNAIVFYWIFASLIYQKKDRIQKVLLFMPFIIGFTRIYLHVHYFSDVLGGFLIGALIYDYYFSLNM